MSVAAGAMIWTEEVEFETQTSTEKDDWQVIAKKCSVLSCRIYQTSSRFPAFDPEFKTLFLDSLPRLVWQECWHGSIETLHWPVAAWQTNAKSPHCIVGVEGKALFCERTYFDPGPSPCTHTHFLVERRAHTHTHTHNIYAVKETHMQHFGNVQIHAVANPRLCTLPFHTHTHSSVSTTAALYAELW